MMIEKIDGDLGLTGASVDHTNFETYLYCKSDSYCLLRTGLRTRIEYQTFKYLVKLYYPFLIIQDNHFLI